MQVIEQALRELRVDNPTKYPDIVRGKLYCLYDQYESKFACANFTSKTATKKAYPFDITIRGIHEHNDRYKILWFLSISDAEKLADKLKSSNISAMRGRIDNVYIRIDDNADVPCYANYQYIASYLDWNSLSDTIKERLNNFNKDAISTFQSKDKDTSNRILKQSKSDANTAKLVDDISKLKNSRINTSRTGRFLDASIPISSIIKSKIFQEMLLTKNLKLIEGIDCLEQVVLRYDVNQYGEITAVNNLHIEFIAREIRPKLNTKIEDLISYCFNTLNITDTYSAYWNGKNVEMITNAESLKKHFSARYSKDNIQVSMNRDEIYIYIGEIYYHLRHNEFCPLTISVQTYHLPNTIQLDSTENIVETISNIILKYFATSSSITIASVIGNLKECADEVIKSRSKFCHIYLDMLGD